MSTPYFAASGITVYLSGVNVVALTVQNYVPEHEMPGMEGGVVERTGSKAFRLTMQGFFESGDTLVAQLQAMRGTWAAFSIPSTIVGNQFFAGVAQIQEARSAPEAGRGYPYYKWWLSAIVSGSASSQGLSHILLDGNINSDTFSGGVAKGDLIAGSSGVLWMKLAIGSNGQPLAVQSGLPAWSSGLLSGYEVLSNKNVIGGYPGVLPSGPQSGRINVAYVALDNLSIQLDPDSTGLAQKSNMQSSQLTSDFNTTSTTLVSTGLSFTTVSGAVVGTKLSAYVGVGVPTNVYGTYSIQQGTPNGTFDYAWASQWEFDGVNNVWDAIVSHNADFVPTHAANIANPTLLVLTGYNQGTTQTAITILVKIATGTSRTLSGSTLYGMW